MQDSVFTKIIKGELPAHKVYEDEKTIVIIPLYPMTEGHVLVISKTQVDQFFDLPDDDYQALMATVKKVAAHMKQVMRTKRVGIRVEGLDVPHVHYHVLAFDTAQEFNAIPDTSQPPDDAKLSEMAAKLAF